MKTLKLILIVTVITLAIGGIYLYVVFKHRQDPGVVRKTDPSETLSKDDLAVVRTFFPAHFEDTQRLEGTSVWMKNGYTMAYFPYAGGRIVFAHPAGVVPAAQRLEIKKGCASEQRLFLLRSTAMPTLTATSLRSSVFCSH